MTDTQNNAKKREILNSVLSNSTFSNGVLKPEFRKPFQILVEANTVYNEMKAVSCSKDDLRPALLLGLDSNLANFVTYPSKAKILLSFVTNL